MRDEDYRAQTLWGVHMATPVTLPLLERWVIVCLTANVSLPNFGIMRICSYSLEPQFVDKESGMAVTDGKLLCAKKVPSFVSETSILFAMELKIPEFGMKFLDWGSEYRLSIEQMGKRRQGWPKRLSNLSMVTKPLELKNQTWAPLCQAVTDEVSCGAQHRREVYPSPPHTAQKDLSQAPSFLPQVSSSRSHSPLHNPPPAHPCNVTSPTSWRKQPAYSEQPQPTDLR